MNREYWKDPENFRPERFLDEKHMIAGSEHVIPFGLGMIERLSLIIEILDFL